MRYKGTREMPISTFENVEVYYEFDNGIVTIYKIFWDGMNVTPLLEEWGKDLIWELKIKLETELNEED